ncbi:hypothetical protein [Natronospora cellulosivora (SeqCode)]
MLVELRRFLFNSVSADYSGEVLFDIVWAQGYDKILENINVNHDYPENELLIQLASLYLFSYYLATQGNAYNFSRKVLNNIHYSFKFQLARKVKNNYQYYKSRTTSIFILLEKKKQGYLDLYKEEHDNIAEKVAESIVQDIMNYGYKDFDDEKMSKLFRDIVLNTITIIQDYLIDLSIKKKVICNTEFKNGAYKQVQL